MKIKLKKLFPGKNKKRNEKIKKVLIAGLPPFLAGGLGGMLTNLGLKDWYPALNKASFNPPSWVFGPAWTILYIFMALATWIMLNKKEKIFDLQIKNLKRLALNYYFLQIVLNFLWTPMFFVLRQPVLALVLLFVLFVVFAKMTLIYAKIDKRTLWFLIPNLLWLSFAAILNASVVFLN